MVVSSVGSLTLGRPNNPVQEHDLEEIGVVILDVIDQDLGPDVLLRLGGVILCDLEDIFNVDGFRRFHNRILGHCAAVCLERRPVGGVGEQVRWIRIPSQLGDFKIARQEQESLGTGCKAAYRNPAR